MGAMFLAQAIGHISHMQGLGNVWGIWKAYQQLWGTIKTTGGVQYKVVVEGVTSTQVPGCPGTCHGGFRQCLRAIDRATPQPAVGGGAIKPIGGGGRLLVL